MMEQNVGNLPPSSSYASLPSIAPQQLQYNAPLPPHTLPPLQGQHGSIAMQSMYGQSMSAPHTPAAAVSHTPGSVGNGAFQQMGGQAALRGYHLQGAAYQQPLQGFTVSSSMMPSASVAMSLPQTSAPTSASTNKGLMTLLPMTSGPPLHATNGMHPLQTAMPSDYSPQSLGQDQETPTHVVGSQGRRGILPSAPGRPVVSVIGNGTTKSATMPIKDADGKFPCPHCTKTYLHAKHLKRHLLRHTGDRPYMCVLCKDTFSRSDILKRHFQKCSIRRGNPTGASHLSAQAHLKKSTSRTAVEDLMRNMNGVNNLPTDTNLVPFGVIPDMLDRRGPETGQNLADEQSNQEHNSLANSLKRLSGGDARGGGHRRSLTGSGHGGSSRASFDQNQNGDIPTTMSSNVNPQLPNFSMPNGHSGPSFGQNYDFTTRTNGVVLQPQEDMSALANGRGTMPMFGSAGSTQQSGVDWAQIFQPGAQDGFMGPFNTNLVENQIAVKTESPVALPQDSLYTSVYPNTGEIEGRDSPTSDVPFWNVPFSQNDPFQQVANQIVNFCFPPGTQAHRQGSDLQGYLSPDNVKHFLEKYTNFQGHFPIIHTSTFRVADTYAGLLSAMICVGAVYSDRVTPGQVRALMEQIRTAIERNSRVLSGFGWDAIAVGSSFRANTIGRQKTDLEEMQAMFLMHSLCTWHGTPVQREMARRHFPVLVQVAQRAGLSQPSTTPSSFSVLHQPNVITEHFNSANFNWNAWVEQEKRSRLFYMIFLCDTSMALYFNIQPQFDSFDVKLPLPANDAAWDARTATQCADALGLHGHVATIDMDTAGSRHAKQPEMNTALKILLDPNANLSAGMTNLYSKFILIHALHVQIWRAHRQQLQDAGAAGIHGLPLTHSRTATPSSQSDWQARVTDGSMGGHLNSVASQRATPVDTEGPEKNALAVINRALEKWKRAWDEDMALQYPPSSKYHRRFGFCRDSVHFYYLGKWLLKHQLDINMAPDQRMTHVMHVLKSVKTWVVSDSAQRGEELGSVNDIDQDYGVSNLTLDMAHLFKPINNTLDSPVAGVPTNIGNGMI